MYTLSIIIKSVCIPKSKADLLLFRYREKMAKKKTEKYEEEKQVSIVEYIQNIQMYM